jgi:hypothetical protein
LTSAEGVRQVPDDRVLGEFGVTVDLVPLSGGTTGGCYRAGDLVLKPDQDEEVIRWIGEVAKAVTPNPGLPAGRTGPLALRRMDRLGLVSHMLR